MELRLENWRFIQTKFVGVGRRIKIEGSIIFVFSHQLSQSIGDLPRVELAGEVN